MIVYICVTTFNISFKVIFVLCLWYRLSFFLTSWLRSSYILCSRRIAVLCYKYISIDR